VNVHVYQSINATRGFSPSFGAAWRLARLVCSLLTTGLMLGVMFYSGYHEPFYGFEWGDAFVHLGMTVFVLGMLAAAIAWTIVGVLARHIPIYWVLLLVWDGFVSCLALFCIWGYVNDLLTY
jgi:hypothetical protein